MSNTDWLDKPIVCYRIKCDMALSERDDGFYTQEEYEQAIRKIHELAKQAILNHIDKAIQIKPPTIEYIFPSKPYDGTNTYEDMLTVCWYYEDALTNIRKELGIEKEDKG